MVSFVFLVIIKFRATKDIDLVLVVEALRSDFIAHFWEFIKQGKYEDNQVEESERKYYRFIKPQTEGFPMQIELFSRKPDVIHGTDEMDLTPIPAEKGTAFHRADDLALICL